jgi:hypothetical protein
MYNVYGVICGTWSEAREVAGLETPAQLEAEARDNAAEDAIAEQDAMEARGGPVFGRFADDDWQDIPW